MAGNFSLHESYHDEEPPEIGSNRAFGCTVGSVLMVIGAAKAFAAGAVAPVAWLICGTGAVLLLLGVFAPSLLATLNRLWSKLGIAIAKVVNPIILALLFFFVVTPMALVMRLSGRRPLNLAPNRAARTYWIDRGPAADGMPSMKRQF